MVLTTMLRLWSLLILQVLLLPHLSSQRDVFIVEAEIPEDSLVLPSDSEAGLSVRLPDEGFSDTIRKKRYNAPGSYETYLEELNSLPNFVNAFPSVGTRTQRQSEADKPEPEEDTQEQQVHRQQQQGDPQKQKLQQLYNNPYIGAGFDRPLFYLVPGPLYSPPLLPPELSYPNLYPTTPIPRNSSNYLHLLHLYPPQPLSPYIFPTPLPQLPSNFIPEDERRQITDVRKSTRSPSLQSYFYPTGYLHVNNLAPALHYPDIPIIPYPSYPQVPPARRPSTHLPTPVESASTPAQTKTQNVVRHRGNSTPSKTAEPTKVRQRYPNAPSRGTVPKQVRHRSTATNSQTHIPTQNQRTYHQLQQNQNQFSSANINSPVFEPEIFRQSASNIYDSSLETPEVYDQKEATSTVSTKHRIIPVEHARLIDFKTPLEQLNPKRNTAKFFEKFAGIPDMEELKQTPMFKAENMPSIFKIFDDHVKNDLEKLTEETEGYETNPARPIIEIVNPEALQADSDDEESQLQEIDLNNLSVKSGLDPNDILQAILDKHKTEDAPAEQPAPQVIQESDLNLPSSLGLPPGTTGITCHSEECVDNIIEEYLPALLGNPKEIKIQKIASTTFR